MSDLEELLRRAVAARVTVISLDTSRSAGTYASAWKAHGSLQQAWGADPIETLRIAVEKAIAAPSRPPGTPAPPPASTDLSDLLG